MLDATLVAQLTTYLANIRHPIELVASLDDGAKSAEMRALLQQIAGLSDKVSARFDGQATRRPSFEIRRVGADEHVAFAAIPLGHEFTSLVLALLHVGGHPPREDAALLEQVRALDADLEFETFISLSCHNCPDVVQALNIMAALNPRVRHTTIDGALFRDEVERRGVMAVPVVLLNGEVIGQGRMTLAEILAKVDTASAARAAEALSDKDPYDILVVGGGPAAAAAAIYAARKGIRTGMVADRIGGQVLDTMGIENFVSVTRTEGPKLATDFEAHIDDYDIDVMALQRAARLKPANGDGLHQLELESGAKLQARSLILATGARWRTLGVPGEEEYKNRGVAYCPHCDGPLFKGKRVAVIGGGNSGVEAVIDLAGIVAHVTLIEFDEQLRADAVLQNKLRSLPNAEVITSARTTAIHGDGGKVTGLSYEDRRSGEERQIALEGVFVQIGLVPNSEWLGETLERTARGEIEIDERCATSLPGVFAAGDVTTVPYKQIVIAAGEGSKAALSAFDHLIRS